MRRFQFGLVVTMMFFGACAPEQSVIDELDKKIKTMEERRVVRRMELAEGATRAEQSMLQAEDVVVKSWEVGSGPDAFQKCSVSLTVINLADEKMVGSTLLTVKLVLGSNQSSHEFKIEFPAGLAGGGRTTKNLAISNCQSRMFRSVRTKIVADMPPEVYSENNYRNESRFVGKASVGFSEAHKSIMDRFEELAVERDEQELEALIAKRSRWLSDGYKFVEWLDNLAEKARE